MNADTLIRTANLEDSPGIAHLLEQLGYPSTVPEVEGRIVRLSDRNSDRVLVAEREGKVVGVAGVHLTPLVHANEFIGRITSFVVDKEYRRHGIGRCLLRAAESWAWSHDCSRIELTSADHRKDAHKFYEACGYRRDERRFLKKKTGEVQ